MLYSVDFIKENYKKIHEVSKLNHFFNDLSNGIYCKLIVFPVNSNDSVFFVSLLDNIDYYTEGEELLYFSEDLLYSKKRGIIENNLSNIKMIANKASFKHLEPTVFYFQWTAFEPMSLIGAYKLNPNALFNYLKEIEDQESVIKTAEKIKTEHIYK